MPDNNQVRAIVAEILAELGSAREPGSSLGMASGPAVSAPQPASTPPVTPSPAAAPPTSGAPPTHAPRRPIGATPTIDLPDPTLARHTVGVVNPANATGLTNLAASTGARLAVGRAGPRPRTATMLLFHADHAVTQDAIFGDVPQGLLDELGMFQVQTRVSGSDEFLLRPDLGRALSDEAKATIGQRCEKNPTVQIVVGDGLSAAAVTNNLGKIYPVLHSGFTAAGMTVGTPFFVRFCRVGIINDINAIVGADVVVLLIGERPGLGVADALSVYSGWRPGPGKTDANRDVVCMITENGGTNPMEAGAFVVEHIRSVVAHQASGIDLRLAQAGGR